MDELILSLEPGSNKSSHEIHVSDNANAVINPLKKKKGASKILKIPIYYSGILFCLLLLITFTFMSVGCEKPRTVYGGEKENPISSPKLVSLIYGGCNNKSEISETQQRSEGVEKDTIILDYQNDTLKVSVSINYICCSDFNAIQTIDNNNISLQITETTPSPDQYCRCECYYTFDYYFTELSQTSNIINVIFDAQDNSKDKNFTKNFNAL